MRKFQNFILLLVLFLLPFTANASIYYQRTPQAIVMHLIRWGLTLFFFGAIAYAFFKIVRAVIKYLTIKTAIEKKIMDLELEKSLKQKNNITNN